MEGLIETEARPCVSVFVISGKRCDKCCQITGFNLVNTSFLFAWVIAKKRAGVGIGNSAAGDSRQAVLRAMCQTRDLSHNPVLLQQPVV
jgi:hypothetical protein